MDATANDRASERNVLFISYAYPPTGGGGVQRSVKFVKYLPKFGWRPTVLTAANPSVPVQDQDLVLDVESSTKVLTARTWEPSYQVKQSVARSSSPQGRFKQRIAKAVRRLGMHLLQPDPQVLWNPQALRVASDEVRSQRFDAIYVTGPPFSSFLLGCKLKKKFDIPLVVDFRDEWMLACRYLENYQHAGRAVRRQFSMMTDVLRTADAVIATTQASACELLRNSQSVKGTQAISCIYNGFDTEDFREVNSIANEEQPRNKFRIVYTGTLWRLTDISPLVDALLHLNSSSPALASQLELIVAGRRSAEQDVQLNRLANSSVDLQRLDYQSHTRSLQLVASADVLLLLLANDAGAERVVPAKLFEYLAVGKPVLSIGPAGEASELLRNIAGHDTLPVDEPEKIASWIAKWLAPKFARISRRLQPSGPALRSAMEPFSRLNLTGELAAILEQCESGRRAA